MRKSAMTTRFVGDRGVSRSVDVDIVNGEGREAHWRLGLRGSRQPEAVDAA